MSAPDGALQKRIIRSQLPNEPTTTTSWDGFRSADWSDISVTITHHNHQVDVSWYAADTMYYINKNNFHGSWPVRPSCIQYGT